MATLDLDQKFLGRIAKQTADTNPFLSDALYQILGLSVLLARRLIRARKLRKLDTSRDTPSLSAYQHILWISREGLSILELYVLPYAQDNQHGAECRVLSVKLRASFYHIFCLFHNQPPVTTTNMASTDPQLPGALSLPLSPRNSNGYGRKTDPPGLSPSSKRAGRQPALREPIDSIVSETSFVTNPYAAGGAGGPVGTPSPRPTINAPPGLNPIPIPQPSSFILPPLNFVPLASGYFSTATSYATTFLHGSHPLRLSVAMEHSAFLWDCLHDHEASRRVARRAIKDVYRAQEAMDDTEFEDAAELVGILGRMMKRKSWEGTPLVGGMASPEPVAQGAAQASGGGPQQGVRAAAVSAQRSPQSSRRTAEGPPIVDPSAQLQSAGAVRSRANSGSKTVPRQKENSGHERTPKSETQRYAGGASRDTAPRAKHASLESDASTTPRSTVRTAHRPSGSSKGTPTIGNSTPITQSAAATLASDTMRHSPTMRNSPTLRRSPPLHFSPPRHPSSQESSYSRQQR
ncbi:14-3-3 protein [Clathrospora elynae]|uniref:14-3-3 protein n=1 Tax=Clathrospora elynae TaxID=706981 RepID=A0A6A5SPZ8_9PLEO|nr:14-3-3 protein [Clathrospora elynae]